MGIVILPTGESVTVDDLNGLANLHNLLKDLKNENFTPLYRISVIKAVSGLGRYAWATHDYLEDLAKRDGEIGKAAREGLARLRNTPNYATSMTGKSDSQGTRLVAGSADPRRDCPPITGGSPDSFVAASRRERNKVEIVPIPDGDGLGSGARVYHRCDFCDKVCLVNYSQRSYSERIFGSLEKYYCTFCLRNDYHADDIGKNILPLTFRGLLGYYYYCFYAIPRNPPMSMTELQDMITLHFNCGIQNPLWRYDPDTYCWFVDFRKVGGGKQQLPINSVLETVVQTLAAFAMYEHVRGASPHKLYLKYKNAVLRFHEDRTRPKGKILSPTLLSCDIPRHATETQKAVPVDVIKNFLPSHLLESGFIRSRR